MENEKVITIGDKIRATVKVKDGHSSSVYTLEQKQKSVSKSDVFETAYNEVSENAGYDNSDEAIEALLKQFQTASEQQGTDPILQGGFSERYKINGEMIDVALIKGTNAVCNNATTGQYETIKMSVKVNQLDTNEVETLEKQYDIDLAGNKVDLNRPNKSAIEDEHITSYLNPNNMSISATFPVSGNDQEEFDQSFQDDFTKIISYGMSSTLTELIKAGVLPADLAEAEIKLTSRKTIEDIIRSEAVARYEDKTEDEIEKVVKDVYGAVSKKLEVIPLTSKNVSINLQISLVEKALKSEQNWTSTNSKWSFFETDTHIMRYRPIAGANHTFPITDNNHEEIINMCFQVFKSFINTCNNMLCDRLNLERIEECSVDLKIPDHEDKLSKVIGVEAKELYKTRRAFKEDAIDVVDSILDTRDENNYTETSKKLIQNNKR